MLKMLWLPRWILPPTIPHLNTKFPGMYTNLFLLVVVLFPLLENLDKWDKMSPLCVHMRVYDSQLYCKNQYKCSTEYLPLYNSSL